MCTHLIAILFGKHTHQHFIAVSPRPNGKYYAVYIVYLLMSIAVRWTATLADVYRTGCTGIEMFSNKTHAHRQNLNWWIRMRSRRCSKHAAVFWFDRVNREGQQISSPHRPQPRNTNRNNALVAAHCRNWLSRMAHYIDIFAAQPSKAKPRTIYIMWSIRYAVDGRPSQYSPVVGECRQRRPFALKHAGNRTLFVRDMQSRVSELWASIFGRALTKSMRYALAENVYYRGDSTILFRYSQHHESSRNVCRAAFMPCTCLCVCVCFYDDGYSVCRFEPVVEISLSPTPYRN